jgi:integrase
MGKNSPTLQETAALLEAAQASGPRDHALACLMSLNGLDVKTVCAARVNDLSLSVSGEPALTVALIGSRRTLVPLAPRTYAALTDHLDGREQGPLLLDDDELTPLSAVAATRILRRLARDAGLGYRLERP